MMWSGGSGILGRWGGSMGRIKSVEMLKFGFVAAACLALSPVYGQAPANSGPEDTQGPAQTAPSQPSPSQTQAAPAPTTPAPSQTKPNPDSNTAGPGSQGPTAAPPATAGASADANPATPAAKPQPGPTVGPNGVVNGIKPGSIEDVNAVGTRDIGARGMGNWYSTESEIKEGKAYSMEIEKSVRFVTDPVVTEYVNRIGQNLVKNSDAKVPFTIKVIDDDSINAMALPGGFFYVNSGAILNADEEAELAGVMAHEIAHVAAHHAMREQTRMNYAQLSTIPLIMIGGYAGYGIYEAANIGIPLTFLQFSRDFERQADYLGLQYMYRAGYDPQAFIAFFEKVQALEKHKPGTIAKAFDTHPQTPDRIEATQKEISQILPPRDQYLVTTSEFNDVKARLARIQNKRKLRDGPGANKPTLRKASGTPNGTNPNGTDTEQPTLHPRDNN
jgi:beta-barrel assembly-enhancing protease